MFGLSSGLAWFVLNQSMQQKLLDQGSVQGVQHQVREPTMNGSVFQNWDTFPRISRATNLPPGTLSNQQRLYEGMFLDQTHFSLNPLRHGYQFITGPTNAGIVQGLPPTNQHITMRTHAPYQTIESMRTD